MGDGTGNQTPVGTPLAGVTYKVKQTHAYDGTEWTQVTNGQEYELTTKEEGDEKGIIAQSLPLGRYSIKEIKGPPHVNLNPEIFHVDIPMTSKDGSTLNYDVHIYPKNETIRGNVKLTKTDGDTGANLEGVQFELYYADGNKVEGTTTFTTVKNEKITVDNLAYGDYYFKEVATLDGYLLGSQRLNFQLLKVEKRLK
ncbi:collagen binding domain-containing protein [Bacillus sp. N9]